MHTQVIARMGKSAICNTKSAIALGALLLLSGCGPSSNQAHRDPPSPDIRVAAINSDASPAAEPAPTSSAPIYHARPQSEIDQIYNTPVVAAPAPAPRTFVPLPTSPYRNDDPVTADSQWNVQITRDWHHIVVHHSASNTGSAAIFDKAHRERGWDGLGYHFVIGNGSGSGDGEVEVGYRWKSQQVGAHAGNAEYNQHGIGICLVGDFENGGRPSSAQMASLRRLVRFLQVKTGIPTSEVIGHGNVPGKNTQCPGKGLDLDSFRASLGGNPMPVPIHITHSVPSSGGARVAHGESAKNGSAIP
jgi:hypothetical protein